MPVRSRESDIARYAEKPSGPRLRFFGKLWDLQDEIAKGAPAWPTPDVETIREALATRQTIFSIEPPAVPVEAYRDAVSRIMELIAEEAELDEKTAEALRDLHIAEEVAQADLQVAVRDTDAFLSAVKGRLNQSGLREAGPAAVDLVLTSALTPFLTDAAAAALERLGEFDWTVWGAGECPVCGSSAAAGHVVDEGELQGGRRELACSLCRAEWEYDRLRCVRCGTRDHTKLHYLMDEQDPGHRVHVCEECKGYITVAFERELGYPTSTIVEEVVMLPLDKVASMRGYERFGLTPEELEEREKRQAEMQKPTKRPGVSSEE